MSGSPVDLAALMLDRGNGSGQPGLVEQTPNAKPTTIPWP